MSEDGIYYPGQPIGDYIVLKELGRGGMGVVYLCQHTYLKKRFAVKVMPQFLSEEPTFAQIFQREAQTLGTLKHPNIVEVHNFGFHGTTQYLVMDYVGGGTIEAYLKSVGGQMPPIDVLATLQSVLAGLSHAHGKGIIHRDLKPENFLLDSDGTVKISDFGIAQLMDAEHSVHENPDAPQSNEGHTHIQLAKDASTDTPITGGTEGYMAPEVAEGSTGDMRSDIYAIGVIAHYLLTGYLPENNNSQAHQYVAKLDKHWNTIINTCLQQEPDQRYSNVEELSQELDKLTKKKSINPILLFSSLCAALILSVLAILVVLPDAPIEPPSSDEAFNPTEITLPPPEPLPTQPEPAPTITEPQKTDTAAPQKLDIDTANRIHNPGFEQQLRGWRINGKGKAKIQRDPENAHSGVFYAELSTTNESTNVMLETVVDYDWEQRGDKDTLLLIAWSKNLIQHNLRDRQKVSTQLRLRAFHRNPYKLLTEQTIVLPQSTIWEKTSLKLPLPDRETWPKLDGVLLQFIVRSSDADVIAQAAFDSIYFEIQKDGQLEEKEENTATEKAIEPIGQQTQQTNTIEEPDAPKARVNSLTERLRELRQKRKQMQEEAESQKEKPKPKKPGPEDSPLKEGMTQLTLIVRKPDGTLLPDENYVLKLNGKAFSPMKGTEGVFRFKGGLQINFLIEPDGHRPWEQSFFAPVGKKAELEITVQPWN